MLHAAAMTNACRVLKQSGTLRVGERVAIVADFETLERATIVTSAARSITPDVNLYVMPQRTVDGEEPPDGIAAAIKHADLVVSLVARSITHTSAILQSLENGSRALMMTAFTDNMLLRGGIEYDFQTNKPFCASVAALLTESDTAHLTTPAGTDLSFDIRGRHGNAHSGVVDEPGQMTTIPNVESSVSPVEGATKGMLIGDASIPYYEIGLLTEPVRMTVNDGRVIDIVGGYQAQMVHQMMSDQNDPNVYNIAQLSFGLNPRCRMQGVMLEDEGVYGTAHIGIGTSSSLGGTVKASMHYDIIMWKPTLKLDEKVVLRDGQWLIS